MKKNNDLFSEKMPQHLKNKILKQADDLLVQRRKKRFSIMTAFLGSALATAASVFVYFKIKDTSHLKNEMAEFFFEEHTIHELIADDEIELLNELELVENLELLENMDEDNRG